MLDSLSFLLVEDNPGDARLLQDVLCDNGQTRVVVAENLSRGLALASQQSFDVLLLDLTLPDSSGEQTITRAASALPRMPIVVLTALADDQVAARAVLKGAQDFLIKGTLDAALILRSVRYAIDRKHAQIALQEAYDHLEEKVRQRTADLQTALDDLRQEAQRRHQAEQERHRAEMEVLQAGEREQRRIGRDLHDSIQGNLGGIKMMLEALKKLVCHESPQHGESFDKIVKATSRTLDQIRSLAHSLCPVSLDGQGLIVALEQLSDNVTSLFGVRCEFKCRNWVGLDQAVATHLYYIANEAVNNSIKHARADQIVITLDGHDRAMLLTIEDNGIGIPPNAQAKGEMGLRTMASRAALIAATLSVQPTPAGGTIVACCLPLGK